MRIRLGIVDRREGEKKKGKRAAVLPKQGGKLKKNGKEGTVKVFFHKLKKKKKKKKTIASVPQEKTLQRRMATSFNRKKKNNNGGGGPRSLSKGQEKLCLPQKRKGKWPDGPTLSWEGETREREEEDVCKTPPLRNRRGGRALDVLAFFGQNERKGIIRKRNHSCYALLELAARKQGNLSLRAEGREKERKEKVSAPFAIQSVKGRGGGGRKLPTRSPAGEKGSPKGKGGRLVSPPSERKRTLAHQSL